MCGLIDHSSGQWNEAAILSVFEDSVAAKGMTIPLSSNLGNDERYWEFTRDGTFTVKLAYWLGMLGKEREEGDVPLTVTNDCWARIWALDLLQKLNIWYGDCVMGAWGL